MGFFAFRTIKVKQSFSEAQFINATVYMHFLCYTAFPDTNLLLHSCCLSEWNFDVFIIIFSASTILCIFFIPKMVILHSDSHLEKTTSESGGINESTLSIDTSMPQLDTVQITKHSSDFSLNSS